jgi:N-acetylglucosamine kinase-like BadF-type ATPase
LDDQGNQKRIGTKGMNPYQQSEEELSREVATALVPQLPSTEIEEVHFYGAGCIYDKIPLMQRVLNSHLAITKCCEVNSDMLGVARALCGHEPGIACILGTGSNTCFYDGVNITKNVSSLGFILGDEGSGSVLGKLFIGALYKGLLGEDIKKEFEQTFNLDAGKIIERVYRQPYANRFLASFAPFIYEHRDDDRIYQQIVANFEALCTRCLMQYDYQHHPIHFCGSIAWYFRDILEKVAGTHQLNVGTIEKAPLEGLVKYHSI